MDRINGAGHVNHRFVSEDVATNRPPTEVTPEWLNTHQEELAGIVEFEGGALDPANNGQVLAKLLALFFRKSGGDLTGAITQKFSGLYWQGTPVGGAFVRKYADIGNAATVGGIEDCTVYNVAVDPVTGVWVGRDVADICWLEKWSDVGGVKELWYAPTAAAAVVPAWQKVDSLDLVNAIRTMNGDLVVTGQIDISSAAAGKIKFPATQNPSGDANTLDDYEEGNWEPTLYSTGATFSYGSAGKYTKIGRTVIAHGYVDTSVNPTGTLTNGVYIGGFPFVNGSGGYGSSLNFGMRENLNQPAGALELISMLDNGSTIAQLLFSTNGSLSVPCLASYFVGSDTRIAFSVTYNI